ncbi:5-methyltetrahydropteroyltriglutamate--homocysteine S-methyltransferase [Arthrobacter sp. JZ12]|uniref:5-methyltetrahydropteroyltriglutamate-- homocysteine S-methyltransferase n=1 Tax=Arthrobacter sp. JZ12 TaxID=2654190 RepID=UPI002B495AF1|nr:5-methyltetrahydropteroyltriglutamate--homocysteine S-methyltransferase [Arthrobacter sp. JZ12]WRH24803.1 5-methyltetrahydropteroyltriglutamate--homocysteine S-methyltransferase [Arthrobacter sp. JZ12]
MTTAFPKATIVGYPRIGRRRELKKAVEAYWAGRTSAAELEATAAQLRTDTYARLATLGLEAGNYSIPASFSLYDQVLDTAVTFGAVSERFKDLYDADGSLGLDAYFTLARGDKERQPLEMTKWFDTNYHYLVPEIGPDTAFSLANDWILRDVAEAAEAGFAVRPTLIGPVTFLLLSKAADEAPAGFDPLSRLDDLLPLYVELLGRLAEAGVDWVQLEEPALVADQAIAETELAAAVERAYAALTAGADRPSILVTTQYGSLGSLLPVLAGTGIDALHIDVFKGAVPVPAELANLGATVLVAGVVDGHNIWKADLGAAAYKVAELEAGVQTLAVATSTSLQHVPHDVEDEQQLDAQLRSWLAFADQKVAEVVTLSRAIGHPGAIDADIAAADEVLASRAGAPGVNRTEVRERAAALTPSDFARGDYADRQAAQEGALNLPALPTTTIGSFPQTAEVRSARARANRGDLTAEQYEQLMKDEIKRVIDLQEELGFDVLVHGEPERNDMVQYFAENLDGFDVTVHGWVQSYGSRCTRPSILWGDVSRPAPITVPWAEYAQSLTGKPVKGMLTGPVTILAWSFVRDDLPLGDTANQVALTLRDEVSDLEAAGIKVIQVDEPALRELLPLRKEDQAEYLEWSVNSFRLSTASAAPSTQIHTHLCYSEFGAIIDAIDGLDADVTSIEAARSRMEVVHDLEAHGFKRGVGPGVYDIHSPRVPAEQEVVELLEKAVQHVPARQLWVNPDCGLKTRGYAETEESLRNLVNAAVAVRAQLGASVS